MDKWGEIDEPRSEQEEMWGGDISDNGEGEEGREELKTEYTFEQKMHSSESNTCGELIVEDPNNKDEVRKAMASLSPIERIKININKIIRTFKENDIFELTSEQRNEICNFVDDVNVYNVNPVFLNPLAFVLGYFVFKKNIIIMPYERETSEEIKRRIKRTKDETEINETEEEKERRKVREKKTANFFKVFGKAEKGFPKLQEMNSIAGDYAVYAPDVIRYGQLWTKSLV